MRGDRILALAAKFDDITKREYDRVQSVLKSKEQGKTGPVPTRPPRRGGGVKGAKIHQFNTDMATFNGLVKLLSDKINTGIHTARGRVTQERDKTHNELKPYVDALSKAIQKGDNHAKYLAIRLLKERMSGWPDRVEGLRLLEKSSRLLPYFMKLRNDLLRVNQWVNEAGRFDLTPPRIAFALDTIQYAARLNDIYTRFYPQFSKSSLPFSPTLEALAKVIDRLNVVISKSYDTLQESGTSGPGE